jgi:hypothetical protein
VRRLPLAYDIALPKVGVRVHNFHPIEEDDRLAASSSAAVGLASL